MSINIKKTTSGVFKQRVFDDAYLSSLTYELALLFRAGIPAADGMAMLAADEPDRRHSKTLNDVAARLESGMPFYDAMSQTPAFPKYMLDMLAVGEASGRLEEVFASLSEYYDGRGRLKRAVRSAVVYPGALAALMLAVAFILVTRVLPVFDDISRQLGLSQSGAARALTDAGRFIGANIAWLLPAAAAAAVIAVILGVALVRRGSVGKSVAAARFAGAMAMSMTSGLDTDRSLELAGELCSDTAARRGIELCKSSLHNGEPFPAAVAASGIFDEFSARMLAVGFRTGSADAAMREIARRCEESAAERVERIAGRLEPALVIVMTLITGFILLSVMLPLMNVMQAL